MQLINMDSAFLQGKLTGLTTRGQLAIILASLVAGAPSFFPYAGHANLTSSNPGAWARIEWVTLPGGVLGDDVRGGADLDA